MWGGGGGGGVERGAHHFQCSLSQPNVQKNSRAHVRGRGGLKLANMLEKTNKPTPKKKRGIGSPVFCTFSFTPNPIT